MSRLVLISCLLTVLLVVGYTAATGSIYAKDNLVAWCIVPFDAAQRGPEARAEMLADIGVRRLAYDWREKDIPTFGAELDALAKHGIELTAFWFPFDLAPQNDPVAQQILKLLDEHKVKTQLWINLQGPALKQLEALSQEEKVSLVAKPVTYLAKRAAATGSAVALYNHGGWYGEPENQIEIIRKVGLDNVGLVYNLHHAAEQISDFPRLFPLMKPYLIAFNVNGMKAGGPMILPVGDGDLELEVMRLVQDSGWKGPVGILDHRDDLDARKSLLQNLRGMKTIVQKLGDAEALKTY